MMKLDVTVNSIGNMMKLGLLRDNLSFGRLTNYGEHDHYLLERLKEFIMKFKAAILLLTVAGIIAAMAAPAMAASTVVARTSQFTPDLTSGQVTSLLLPNAGYVWAFDAITIEFIVQPTGGNAGPENYTVHEIVHGSFSAFSEPNNQANLGMNNPLSPRVNGRMHGSNFYYVHSSVAPRASLLPSSEPDGMSVSAMINQMFGGHATDSNPASGNRWIFSYHPTRGGSGELIKRWDLAPALWGNISPGSRP